MHTIEVFKIGEEFDQTSEAFRVDNMNTNSVGIVRMKETKSSGSSVQVHIAVHVHVIHGRLERFRVEIEQMNRGEVYLRQWVVILNGSIRR